MDKYGRKKCKECGRFVPVPRPRDTSRCTQCGDRPIGVDSLCPHCRENDAILLSQGYDVIVQHVLTGK